MKKNFLILSLSLIMISATAFAGNDPKVSSKILESFKKEFPEAQQVQWNEGSEYSSAVFVLGDFRAQAWFDSNGELVGTLRDLLYNQLPLTVMRRIESKYPDANPMEIKEITNANGTSYNLKMEDKKFRYTIVATPNGEISVSKKTKK